MDVADNVYTHKIVVKNEYLDSFGHVNNAVYLQLFEKARWEIITSGGYGLEKIQETGLGPTILKIEISFLKELRLNDEVIIESKMLPFKKKVGAIYQRMLRNNEVVCEATFLMGIFSLEKRKLVLPTSEWLHALGLK